MNKENNQGIRIPGSNNPFRRLSYFGSEEIGGVEYFHTLANQLQTDKKYFLTHLISAYLNYYLRKNLIGYTHQWHPYFLKTLQFYQRQEGLNIVSFLQKVQGYNILFKGAILAVKNLKGLFLRSLFLVGKKDGGNRPVISLKELNKKFSHAHFKMEGLSLLKEMLLPGEFMCNIDVYFTVPLSKHSQKYFRF